MGREVEGRDNGGERTKGRGGKGKGGDRREGLSFSETKKGLRDSYYRIPCSECDVWLFIF